MLTLKALKRDLRIKPKIVREKGDIPAVYYGMKEKATPIVIHKNDFVKVWNEAGESTVVMIQGTGKDISALIHDVQLDPLRGEPIHVDFYAIEADKEVEVSVELEFIGVSPAVKELGGTLVKVLREIEVRGLPKDLPAKIEVDISPLVTLESQISIKDLVVPNGISFLADTDEIVAMISVAKEEEEAPVPFDATQIEVEEKGKKESEESEEAETEKKEKK